MIQDNNKPSPSNRHQVMRYLGKSFVIEPLGKTVWGPGTRDLAEIKCEALNAEADARRKRGKRPCLCCGETFLSEGIHYRMCNRSRSHADPLGNYAYSGQSDRRRPRALMKG